MISEIRIDQVASYTSPVTLETDKKVNIIYGLNGAGKSTLSNYLFNRQDIRFKSCSVDIDPSEELLVYNQKFIHENFFDADSLRGVFSLSKENKEIEEKISAETKGLALIETQKENEQIKINEEKGKQNTLFEGVKEKLFAIKRSYTGGDRVLEYCLERLKTKDPLFKHMIATPKPAVKPSKNVDQIKSEVEALNGDDAKKYELLPMLEFDGHGVEGAEIFSELIVGSADSPVASLISELGNSNWVKEGLEFIPGEIGEDPVKCPFCQEDTITQSLAEEIKGYFDDSYAEAVDSIAGLLSQYENAAQALLPLDSYNSNALVEKHLTALSQAHSDLKQALEANIRTIHEKQKDPSVKLSLNDTTELVAAFQACLNLINQDIEKHNERFDNIENELAALKNEFWLLMRWDYDQMISSYVSDKTVSDKLLQEAEERMANIVKADQEARSRIVDLQTSTVNIEEAVSNINSGLVNLGITSFSILKHGDARYRIARSDTDGEVFSSLSEGEKMIISLLYFCEVCKGKLEATDTPKKKVVVFDDPVSSLSHIYVYNVGRMLKQDFFDSDRFEQIFVLTHSLYFFYELADSNHTRRHEKQCLFRLSKNDVGSSIQEMSYEQIQNDYQSYWSVINDKDQHPALIANCMRNIVEYFFNFVEKLDLNNVFGKNEFKNSTRFQAFCRYMNRESHSLGQNIFDFKEFNYDDFREGLKLVFELAGYPEHYKKMTKSIP